MAKDLISKRTQTEFREFLVGWTLREISDEFDAEGVECHLDYVPPNMSGQRRTLVEQYYHSLDLSQWADTRKLLRVFENILNCIAANDLDDVQRLSTFLKRDGFVYRDGRIRTSTHGLPTLGQALGVAAEFDTAYMMAQIERIESSIDSEPDLAIGSAKELLETCCKTILADRGQMLHENPDLPKLVKATMRELKLLPDDIPDKAKGVDVIKRMLSNLASVAQGLTEIRNLYGSGHGKYGRTSKIKPRHAKLAVGAATTLVVFLFETHRETMAEIETSSD